MYVHLCVSWGHRSSIKLDCILTKKKEKKSFFIVHNRSAGFQQPQGACFYTSVFVWINREICKLLICEKKIGVKALTNVSSKKKMKKKSSAARPHVPAVFAALEERAWGGGSHNEVSALHSSSHCVRRHGNNQDCRGNRLFISRFRAAAQNETLTVGDNVNTATSAHLCCKLRMWTWR